MWSHWAEGNGRNSCSETAGSDLCSCDCQMDSTCFLFLPPPDKPSALSWSLAALSVWRLINIQQLLSFLFRHFHGDFLVFLVFLASLVTKTEIHIQQNHYRLFFVLLMWNQGLESQSDNFQYAVYSERSSLLATRSWGVGNCRINNQRKQTTKFIVSFTRLDAALHSSRSLFLSFWDIY